MKVTVAQAKANLLKLAGEDGTDPLTRHAEFWRHEPVLEDGEITEIEMHFKDADDRNAKITKTMDPKMKAVADSMMQAQKWVRDRHAEIIEHLRADRNGVVRKRWR